MLKKYSVKSTPLKVLNKVKYGNFRLGPDRPHCVDPILKSLSLRCFQWTYCPWNGVP